MNTAREELKVTHEELASIQKALANDEFKKMFFDYVQEISDPENMKLYEEDIRKLELEKGNDVKFVTPTPGFVLKTTILNRPPKGHLKNDSVTEGSKAFINVCSNNAIGEAKAKTALNEGGRKGQQWEIPYSLTAREDQDKASKPCAVYDFMVHPDTIELSGALPGFRNLLVSSAFEGIEKRYGVKVNPEYKTLNLKYKGVPTSTMMREKNPSVQPANETTEEFLHRIKRDQDKHRARKEKEESQREAEQHRKKLIEELQDGPVQSGRNTTSTVKTPKYQIIHKGKFDLANHTERSYTVKTMRPEQLVVRVELPGVVSIATANLDMSSTTLDLIVANLYELHVSLPFEVDADRGAAKFDKTKQRMEVTLPVVPPKVEMLLQEQTNTIADVSTSIPEEVSSAAPLSANESPTNSSECDNAPQGTIQHPPEIPQVIEIQSACRNEEAERVINAVLQEEMNESKPSCDADNVIASGKEASERMAQSVSLDNDGQSDNQEGAVQHLGESSFKVEEFCSARWLMEFD